MCHSFLLRLLIIIIILSSCNSNKYRGVENNELIRQSKIDLLINETAMSSVSKPDVKQKINSAFTAWKANEVKQGRMCASIQKYREEMEKFLEEQGQGENNQSAAADIQPTTQIDEYYDDGDRFMYIKTLKTLYADFNGDGIDDGMMVYERDDCLQGAGYVGDWEKAVMFLSSKNGYKLNNKIITDAVKRINKNALGYFSQNSVGYIKFRTATASTIGGSYLDWKQGDPSGSPSYQIEFVYDFKTRKIKFSKF